MDCDPCFAQEDVQQPVYNNVLAEHEAFLTAQKKSNENVERDIDAVSANISEIQRKKRQKLHNSEQLNLSIQTREELQCEEVKKAKTLQNEVKQLKQQIEKTEKELRCEERLQQKNIETLRNQVICKKEEMGKVEAELQQKLEKDCKCDLLLHDEKCRFQDGKELRDQTRKSIEQSHVESIAYQLAPDYIKSKQRELKRLQEEKVCTVQCANEVENKNLKLQTELDILEKQYHQVKHEQCEQETCIKKLEDEIRCAELEKECYKTELGQLTRQLKDIEAKATLHKRLQAKLADQTRCQETTLRALEQNYQTCGNDQTDTDLESTDTNCKIRPTDCLGRC